MLKQSNAYQSLTKKNFIERLKTHKGQHEQHALTSPDVRKSQRLHFTHAESLQFRTPSKQQRHPQKQQSMLQVRQELLAGLGQILSRAA